MMHENRFELLVQDERVCQMKQYPQHGVTTTYDHCVRVAKTSLKLAKYLGEVDQEALLVGAMLHDYFLYDWHAYDNGEHLNHGWNHPHTALCNAERDFSLTAKERDIIRNHMWPLTLLHMPGCKEAWIVCLVDKWVSMVETINRGSIG